MQRMRFRDPACHRTPPIGKVRRATQVPEATSIVSAGAARSARTPDGERRSHCVRDIPDQDVRPAHPAWNAPNACLFALVDASRARR